MLNPTSLKRIMAFFVFEIKLAGGLGDKDKP